VNTRVPYGYRPVTRENQDQSSFDEFEATELYCPTCKRAVPVIKTLLLILPDGDKYEYRCRFCGSVVGDKIDRHGQYYTTLKM
jgi:uncharacterized protein YbaR (Trm112 family)